MVQCVLQKWFLLWSLAAVILQTACMENTASDLMHRISIVRTTELRANKGALCRILLYLRLRCRASPFHRLCGRAYRGLVFRQFRLPLPLSPSPSAPLALPPTLLFSLVVTLLPHSESLVDTGTDKADCGPSTRCKATLTTYLPYPLSAGPVVPSGYRDGT
ncbi:hypothetical protein B0T14DRAFT_108046 [Immersiella caudata]|uniref:Secreted protein n=1 Tax=Immersiella caudata TaxID=314043 RepID=A0AA39X3D4_9PEZI|nr:hypothetical protein B0T14DRAFT_108046 [Immersiella caudata]